VSTDDRERWQARWATRDAEPVPGPHPFVVACLPSLPRRGRALDLAGGTGRHALLLAEHGLDVTLADIAPAALSRARREAVARGLPLRVVEVDAELGLPTGPWDVVVVSYFLARAHLGAVARALAPGGLLVHVHPTHRNLERNTHPSARVLLRDGELAALLGPLVPEVLVEGWFDGTHEARCLARRPR
jgi:SAM-dependent methyltransferase